MPEIYNNPDNNQQSEQNNSIIESQVENLTSIESTLSESQIESSQSLVEQPTIYESEQHIKQVVENQKQIHQSNTSNKQLSAKVQEKYIWLLSIPEENRVEVSVKLITTKGKNILEVIHAFLAIEDYVALDRLEESLNAIYPTLVQEGLLPDVHDK
jgi:hypothetical protein